MTVKVKGNWSTHGLDEVLQTQLDGQSRLSHTAVSQHDELVQHHAARHDGRVELAQRVGRKRSERMRW